MKRQAEIFKYTSLNKITIQNIGIYKIFFTNDPKNRVYIGSAIGRKIGNGGFYKRWNSHLSSLKTGKYRGGKLQKAYNKYGLENMRFEPIDILKSNYCRKYYDLIETGYIAKYNSVKNGWNILFKANSTNGKPAPKQLTDKTGVYKLVEKDIINIISDFNSRVFDLRQLSEKYEINSQHIGAILSGRSWSDYNSLVDKEYLSFYKENYKRFGLNKSLIFNKWKEVAIECIDIYNSGIKKYVEIARLLGVDPSLVRKVIIGKSYKELQHLIKK